MLNSNNVHITKKSSSLGFIYIFQSNSTVLQLAENLLTSQSVLQLAENMSMFSFKFFFFSLNRIFMAFMTYLFHLQWTNTLQYNNKI